MNREEEEVEGIVFSRGKWIAKMVPFPLVLYDRYYSEISGFDQRLERIRDELGRKCMFVNPPEFSRIVTNKVEFSVKMQRYGFHSPVIYADRIVNEKELACLLTRHQAVVAKPVYGRMGRGIVRIEQDRIGTRNEYRVRTENREIRCSRPMEVAGILRHLAREQVMAVKDFMIQESIDIERIRNRWYDVRVLMQRTRPGSPDLTGMVIRVSNGTVTVPNLDQGGLVMDPEFCFGAMTENKSGMERMEKCRRICNALYLRFEEEYGDIGEIGFDLLIDRKDKIWILEINSKPGRWAFWRLASGFGLDGDRRRMYAETRMISIEKVMQYGRWLCEKSLNEKEN